MPTLTRKLIRQDIVARLKAANTAAGDRVFDSRTTRLTPDDLPCVEVAINRGVADSDISTATAWTVTDTVSIRSNVRLDASDDDRTPAERDAAGAALADDLGDEVLKALFGAPDWSPDFGKIGDLQFSYGLEAEGGHRIGQHAVTFDLTYHRQFEPTYTDSFDSYHAEVDFTSPGDGPDGEIEGRFKDTLEGTS